MKQGQNRVFTAFHLSTEEMFCCFFRGLTKIPVSCDIQYIWSCGNIVFICPCILCNIRRSNNSSDITGVCTYAKRYKLRDGTIRETWYWEASWPDTNGKAVSVNFSVKKYGEDVARSKAIKARRLGLENLEGVFWPSERGVVEAPVLQSPTGLQQNVRRVA